jgi:hypothetical protein
MRSQQTVNGDMNSRMKTMKLSTAVMLGLGFTTT